MFFGEAGDFFDVFFDLFSDDCFTLWGKVCFFDEGKSFLNAAFNIGDCLLLLVFVVHEVTRNFFFYVDFDRIKEIARLGIVGSKAGGDD